MPHGFEVFNSSGIKVIDSDSPCLVLAQKTSITAWTGAIGDLGSVQTISITYNGRSDSVPVPVIYTSPSLHGSTYVAGIVRVSRSGNSWTYLVGIAYGMGISAPSPSGGTFLLIYDRPGPVASGSGRGLVVYDAAGLVTFAGPISPTDGAILKPVGLENVTFAAGTYGAMASFLRIEDNYDYSQNTDQTYTLIVREFCFGATITSTGVGNTEIESANYVAANSSGGGNGTLNYGINQDIIVVNLAGSV